MLTGTIIQQYTGRCSIGGTKVNFICEYDDGPAEQALTKAEYTICADGPYNSWFLLQDADDVNPVLRITQPCPVFMPSSLSPTQPHPCVRELNHQMDNCAGTNKSQYTVGAEASLCALAIFDVARINFMVPYNGKFGPDVLAQKAAGSYNRGDTFNLAMLQNHFSPYSTACTYDGALLRTWKEGTTEIFNAVAHITSYRGFILLADDGMVQLEPTEASAEYTNRCPDQGSFYSEQSLMREASLLKERSLHLVVEAVKQGSYCGVGAGATDADVAESS